MFIGTFQLSSDTACWFKQVCQNSEVIGLSRTALAEVLCHREQLSSRAAAQKLLPKLAAHLKVELPRTQVVMPEAHPLIPTGFPDKNITASLSALGGLTIERVTQAERPAWEAMMASHHPEGWRRSPGGRILYWLRSSRYGVLGGLSFVSAGYQLRPRDEVIGWSPQARQAHIGRVLCNNRFLLLPSVRVHGLASRALQLATSCIADDWAYYYQQRPWLLQTFVAPEYKGTCYQSTGWICCPRRSSGRRSGLRRKVWLHPLVDSWQEQLCVAPARVLGQTSEPWCEGDWGAREYARCAYPDGRIRRRIMAMGQAWLVSPGAPLPALFPRAADQQAAYRLLSNEAIKMDDIMFSHYEATVARCRSQPVVLAVQDTTTLNYDTLVATVGLDHLGGGGKGTRGLLPHCGVAVTPAGRPLGLYDMDVSFRQDPSNDSKRWVRMLDRSAELAEVCPASRVVTICDREGDFWALLTHARTLDTELLVRANKGVKRRVKTADGEAIGLWQYMARQPSLGTRRIAVPRRGGPQRRAGRTATLTLRCREVTLVPPEKYKDDQPLRVIVVDAREESPPPKHKALHWMLVTTTRQQPGRALALETLHFYERRWSIERFFHALKVGTRLQDRRLDAAEDLAKCLAFDAITAMRVWELSRLASEHPKDWARQHESPMMLTVLCSVSRWRHLKVPRGPPEDMTMAEFVVLIAGLAGFRPSRRQPLPGTQKLWEGLLFLNNYMMGYQAALADLGRS